MSDQPDASEQQGNADADKEIPQPQSAVLNAENDTKVTSENTDKAQNTAARVQVPPALPGRIRRTLEWVKRKSSDASLADWAMVFFTFVIAASTIGFTVYARRQWQEMQSGGSDTHELAVAAAKQAEAMKALARASLVLGSPVGDAVRKNATFTLINNGRLQSGPVDVTFHEATINVVQGENLLDGKSIIEKHWKHTRLSMSENGHPFNFVVPFTFADMAKLGSAQQMVIISGKISYTDGFEGDPIQGWPFCSQTRLNTDTRQVYWTPCGDAAAALSRMEQLDGYPEHEQPDYPN